MEDEDVLKEADCLEAMRSIPGGSVHLVLCDLPYGTTQNPWDSVIPLDKLWAEYRRVLAPGGCVILTSQGIFTAKIILSNEAWFKYKLVYVKSKATNFLNAKKQPLRKHEDVCVFAPGPTVYNPQMTAGEPYDKGTRKDQQTGAYGTFARSRVASETGERYPVDVLYFATAESEGPVWHSTQKPVALGRYLVRTYSNPGEMVLDNAFGSGSFLVAAVAEGRRVIGIEKNQGVQAFRGAPVDLIQVAEERLSGVPRERGLIVQRARVPSPKGPKGPCVEMVPIPRKGVSFLL